MSENDYWLKGLREPGFCGVLEPDPTRVYWWDGEFVEVIRGASRDYHVSKSRPLFPVPSGVGGERPS